MNSEIHRVSLRSDGAEWETIIQGKKAKKIQYGTLLTEWALPLNIYWNWQPAIEKVIYINFLCFYITIYFSI